MEKILISACLTGYLVRCDGTFENRLVLGMGVTTFLLIENGVRVFFRKLKLKRSNYL
jgi:uncharacterized protein YbbK (DUF523 family)